METTKDNPDQLAFDELAVDQRNCLLKTLKLGLIERLKLKVKPEEMANDVEIFGAGLGLDSVDALLMALVIETEFEVEVSDHDIAEFQSLNGVIDFIQASKQRRIFQSESN